VTTGVVAMERKVPPEVKEIQERIQKIQIKPVESMAAKHFEMYGREFHKAAIRAVLRSNK
jgi:hypothetical protein